MYRDDTCILTARKVEFSWRSSPFSSPSCHAASLQQAWVRVKPGPGSPACWVSGLKVQHGFFNTRKPWWRWCWWLHQLKVTIYYILNLKQTRLYMYIRTCYIYVYIYTLTTNLVSLLHDERGWPVMTSTYSGAFRLQKLSKRSMMNCNSSSYKVQQVDESNENGGMKQEPAKKHIWGTICNEPTSDKLDAFAWISRLATNTRCPLFVWVWIQCIKHNATLAVL